MNERAMKILLSAYWGAQGWKSGAVSDEDFAFAKSHGVMFPKKSFKHASLVRDTISVRDSVGKERVAQAFVASLSTRKLWLRSALGSFGNCEALTAHCFRPHPMSSMNYLCDICYAMRVDKACLNTLNFERIKWGGVRHAEDLIYNWFDLHQLAKLDLDAPSTKDKKIIRALYRESKRAAAAREGTGKLKKRFKPLLPCNAQELDTLLGIMIEAKLILIDGSKIDGCAEEVFEDLFDEYL